MNWDRSSSCLSFLYFMNKDKKFPEHFEYGVISELFVKYGVLNLKSKADWQEGIEKKVVV